VTELYEQANSRTRGRRQRIGRARSGICKGCGHQGSLFSKKYDLCMECFKLEHERLLEENRNLKKKLEELYAGQSREEVGV
jgi:hypothetical protein